MGYIFLAIAALVAFPENPLARSAAIILMFAHGISIALLFGLADRIERNTGSMDLQELGGLAKSAPGLAFLFGIAAMASIGLPGFAGFAAEVMVFFGAFSGGPSGAPPFNLYQITTIIAVWGVVISAVYMLRAYRKVFLGEATGRWASIPEIGWVTRISVSALLILLLIAGFWPPLLLKYLSPSLLVP